MPDIDIDIQDSRRSEVIDYVTEKYGTDRVANIVTFGKMFARNAVRDVARVLQVPLSEADRLAKMIPPPVQGRHIPLKASLNDDVDLKKEYENNPTAKKIFDLACILEGTVRSHGVHAAGVVIAPNDIVNYVPLERVQKGGYATQYSMGPIEDIGLLKIDFLGLSNLTIIKNTLRIIKKAYKKNIEIESIPLDDKKTFSLLQKGNTTGVFQLESAGMKRYLKELKPNVFDDIVAMVALYRPGPMQFIDDFISRKHGKKEIRYMHDAMKPALESTYGVLVYQEQVMQISKELSGFTGGQADTLRKAIGKKQLDTLAKMKEAFIDGAVKVSNANRDDMEAFWKQLEDFAAYCFNKSHAACYGLIAYQTAYLKAHYPSAFMAALMTNDHDNTDRLSIEISECKNMGIEVLPPEINESFHEFAVIRGDDSEKIRFGLDAIKNVGKGAVEEVLIARDDKKFENISDFISRVNPRVFNRKNWESFIKTGVFDKFGTRSSLLFSLDNIILLASKLHKNTSSTQVDLFGSLVGSDSDIQYPTVNLQEPTEQITQQELLQWERELLGIYLSHHPLKDYEKYLLNHTYPISQIESEDDSKVVTIGGTISEIKQITTRNGMHMAFVKLEDMSGDIEVIVFPGILKDNPNVWHRDKVIKLHGKVSGKDKNGISLLNPKFIVDSAEVINHEIAINYEPSSKPTKNIPKMVKKISKSKKDKETTKNDEKIVKLFVRINSSQESEKLIALKKTIEGKNGNTEIVLVLGNAEKREVIRLPHKITIDEETIREIAEIVGVENVIAQ
jgi:DNA polymerase-3 subunit alpha